MLSVQYNLASDVEMTVRVLDFFRFRRPGIEPLDTEALLEFLAPFTDMNEMRFISVTMPTGSIAQDPPIAPEELLVEGSGGAYVSWESGGGRASFEVLREVAQGMKK